MDIGVSLFKFLPDGCALDHRCKDRPDHLAQHVLQLCLGCLQTDLHGTMGFHEEASEVLDEADRAAVVGEVTLEELRQVGGRGQFVTIRVVGRGIGGEQTVELSSTSLSYVLDLTLARGQPADLAVQEFQQAGQQVCVGDPAAGKLQLMAYRRQAGLLEFRGDSTNQRHRQPARQKVGLLDPADLFGGLG